MTDARSTGRTVQHATFTIERTYDAAPARVFAAFSRQEVKGKWFAGPAGWTRTKWEMDFRVGGREVHAGGPPGGSVHTFVAHYLDIVPDVRIVYAYDMFAGDDKLSVSLATIEVTPIAGKTRLTVTEHGAFLDGHEDPALREHGTNWLLDKIAGTL